LRSNDVTKKMYFNKIQQIFKKDRQDVVKKEVTPSHIYDRYIKDICEFIKSESSAAYRTLLFKLYNTSQKELDIYIPDNNLKLGLKKGIVDFLQINKEDAKEVQRVKMVTSLLAGIYVKDFLQKSIDSNTIDENDCILSLLQFITDIYYANHMDYFPSVLLT